MLYLSLFGFNFDRYNQTFYAEGVVDFSYYDPQTGEDLSDWTFHTTIDGYSAGSGYGAGYMSFVAFNDYVSTGSHTITVTATSDWTGETADWVAELVNDTRATADQYYAGTTGIDIVFGSNYNDDYYLGGGNDFADGGSGSDLLDGGCGVIRRDDRGLRARRRARRRRLSHCGLACGATPATTPSMSTIPRTKS